MHDHRRNAEAAHELEMTSMENKARLRAEMKAARSALPAETRAQLSRQIADLAVGALGIRPGMVVSGFLSIGDELDTGPLLVKLHAAGAQLCLPVMQGKAKPLLFRAYAPGDDLDTVIWGIREPKTHQPVLKPELILLPLLAFDIQGWRLGYGGGFYDRTLREARGERPVRAIGLAFDLQKVDRVPHLDYDEPIDGVMTPSGLIRCR